MEGKQKKNNISRKKKRKMSSYSNSENQNRKKKLGSYHFATDSIAECKETSIAHMFAAITDKDDPNIASMEGICKLCEMLELDPIQDIRILVLLWKMDANDKPGQISKTEWISGCMRLHVDSVDKLKSLLPGLDTGFLENSEFRKFIKFCFKFNLHGSRKTLDKDLALGLMRIALGDRVAPERLNSFNDFLKSSKDNTYNQITLDQWSSFWDFCVEVPDIKNYDEESSAWPTLIDDYIEYMEKMQI